VTHELAQHMTRVPLVHHDDAVKAFTPERTDKALGDCTTCAVAIGVNTVLMPMRRARATKSPP
jgi:hypothetical protein